MSIVSDSKLDELIEINTDSTILSVLQELKERRNSEWVSVKDELPVINEGSSAELIICTDEGVFTGMYFYPDSTFCDDMDTVFELSEVTYWMTIPFPPKEIKE